MSTSTRSQAPKTASSEHQQERRKDHQSHNIWSRCKTLLQARAYERHDAERSAILGYN